MIFGENDPFFDAVCEGEGDVRDTEEAFTLRCEAAAERVLWKQQNFMKLTFHWPILKPTTSAQNHNKEHMELKFNMKEVPNGTFCSFLLQRTKKSTLK